MHSRPQKAQKLRSIHHLYFLHLINFVPLLSFRLCTIPRPFFPSFLHRPDHRYLKRRQQLVQEEQRDGLTEGQRVVRYLRYNFLLNLSAAYLKTLRLLFTVFGLTARRPQSSVYLSQQQLLPHASPFVSRTADVSLPSGSASP